MEITLGPVLAFWKKQDVLDFYREAEDWPVDRIYLGETVCAKRRELRLDDWLTIARNLKVAGKEVVLSTLTLLEAASELASLRKICGNGEFLVEANDVGAIQLLSEACVPFVAGPAINIYNAYTLREMVNAGMQRWVMPVELSGEALTAILAQSDALGIREKFTTEVFSYGYLPLAWSARCFTARAYDLPKDDCQFRCLDHPDGLAVFSQEGERLFTLNGIQTQSGLCSNLLPQWQNMAEIGVDAMRISPRETGTGELVQKLRESMTSESSEQLPLQSVDQCNGYWFCLAGMNSTLS
ncbi:U32 family peptidase [Kistimonas scapharcae]|uniref:Ubiquinone biosynthesis protein UbiV n=1 Tax=Kistimonas scapharcae TaxID=1036133 RepID=A0ABP8VB97_9GAMM